MTRLMIDVTDLLLVVRWRRLRLPDEALRWRNSLAANNVSVKPFQGLAKRFAVDVY
jgi:hypothetical protein